MLCLEIKPHLLKPHPLNASIYDAMDEESEQYKELLKSIKENGVQEPLIIKNNDYMLGQPGPNFDGTILSGHRRWQIATKLELHSVPCISQPPITDERSVLIESNRYRRKTTSELMREAELLEVIAREKAAAQQGKLLPEGEKPLNVRKIVSAEIGMKARSYSKVREIYEAAKTNENAALELKKIDRGEKSIDAAFKSLRPLLEEKEPNGDGLDIPSFIQFTTSWRFAENDPRFGIPHPGRIPGQIAGNVIYYFSEPEDLIIDPMAGGGSTLDAAEFLDRKSLGFDLHPRRPDITQWDISKGFPGEAEGAQLIFMDPPYWNMMKEGYKEGSSSDLTLDEFKNWYRKLMLSAAQTIRVGGFVAVIIMPQYFRLPDDFKPGYIDWPFLTYEYMQRAELTEWARFSCSFPITLFTAFDVERAKRDRSWLPLVADIVVARRMK